MKETLFSLLSSFSCLKREKDGGKEGKGSHLTLQCYVILLYISFLFGESLYLRVHGYFRLFINH